MQDAIIGWGALLFIAYGVIYVGVKVWVWANRDNRVRTIDMEAVMRSVIPKMKANDD